MMFQSKDYHDDSISIKEDMCQSCENKGEKEVLIVCGQCNRHICHSCSLRHAVKCVTNFHKVESGSNLISTKANGTEASYVSPEPSVSNLRARCSSLTKGNLKELSVTGKGIRNASYQKEGHNVSRSENSDKEAAPFKTIPSSKKKVFKSKVKCRIHVQKMVEIFCVDHKTPCCEACKDLWHSGCSVESVQEPEEFTDMSQ